MVAMDKSIAPTTIMESIQTAIIAAIDGLIADQNEDGHWRYPMEPFVFASSFHIVTMHYVTEKLDPVVQQKIGRYIRNNQLSTGGWGFVPHEKPTVSNSVISYFALRLIGDRPDEPHMVLARKTIMDLGGVEAVNILTRNHLALFGIVPWSCIPCMPVELMLLPDWFPFTINKIAPWARNSLVPILILQALNKRPKKPTGVTLKELFLGDPADMPMPSRLPHMNRILFNLFNAGDRILKLLVPYIPSSVRAKAMHTAKSFIQERLNGVDDFSSFIPCMFYVPMVFEALDCPYDHPDRVAAIKALNRLVEVRENDAFTQPTVSPTWDTVNIIAAFLESGEPRVLPAVQKALEYLRPRQILNVKGDWAHNRPDLRPGGWCFFYKNPGLPDTEDTCGAIYGMYRYGKITGSAKYAYEIERGTEWLLGMQCEEGGWSTYSADNTYYYLNSLPAAADSGCFLDPPTTDVTCNVLLHLIALGHSLDNSEVVRRAVQFILRMQKSNGSWLGRWAVNYVYATPLAIRALTSAGIQLDHPSVTKGILWLLSVQNLDGGWGEGITSFEDVQKDHVPFRSTASQTAWALMGLVAGIADPEHPAITAGITYLLKNQKDDGLWVQEEYTGVGHPGLIMFRYHGYCKYFPLQALIHYKKKMESMVCK